MEAFFLLSFVMTEERMEESKQKKHVRPHQVIITPVGLAKKCSTIGDDAQIYFRIDSLTPPPFTLRTLKTTPPFDTLEKIDN